MKRKTTSIVLFLIIIALGLSAKNSKSDILGPWQLTSQKINGVNQNLTNVIKIKLITTSYFTWFSCDKVNRITRNSVGGTCAFDGRKYTETIEFVGIGSTKMLHHVNVFEVVITGNKMHLLGVADKIKYDEIWTRVGSK